MGQDLLRTTIVGLVFFIIFSSLTLSFFLGVADVYGKDTSKVANGSLDISLFNEARNNLSNTSKALSSRFYKSADPENEEQDPTGIWSVIKSIGNMATYPFLLLGNVALNVLNVPKEFLIVIIAIISLSILFGMWRMWKAGD